jgi:dihydroorotate dehydrogenase
MSKIGFVIDKPMMNAAGMLGFSPDSRVRLDLSQFGIFVTNPISYFPRKPVNGHRFFPFPGGFLLHTGYPNPGLRSVIMQHRKSWASCPVPVFVNLLAQDPNTLKQMVQMLEGLEQVFGVEVSIKPGSTPDSILALARAAAGELGVVIRLPLEEIHLLSNDSAWVDTIKEIGVDAVSVAPVRGIVRDGENNLISGRLYGPSQLPLALAIVPELIATGIPVIATGGIYNTEDIQSFLDLGAIAVQLGSVLCQQGFPLVN